MIIKVKVVIESSIENLDASGLPEGDIEKNIAEADGFYRFSEGNIFLSYIEKGDNGVCRTEITSIGGELTVRRGGAIESEMRFMEGESHSSVYSIPPYQFDVTVTTKRIRLDLTDSGGKINLFYNMKIGGADKSARMKIWISQASNQN